MDNSERNVSRVIEEKIKDLRTDAKKAHEELKEFVKDEIKKIQKGTKKAQGEIVGVSNQRFEKIENESKKYHTEFKALLRSEFEKSKDHLKNHAKENDELFRSGGFYILLRLKLVLMIAVIVFYCTSTHISEVKPCGLKTALDLVYLNYTFQPCKYGAVKEMSNQLRELGKAQFWFNVTITFFVIVCLYISRLKNEKMRLFLLIIFLFLFVSAIAFFIASTVIYSTFDEKKNEYTDIDYVKLQALLLSWLRINYKTDTISNRDKISKGWNNFFIQYDCCAVREVQSTTNDFDDTPWCTTSGSCQATASQLPKTCCKDVTQDDYQNAPATCHASANPGTYRQSCIGRIRGLGIVDIDEVHVSVLCISLLTVIVLQIFEATLASGLFICGIIRLKRLQTDVL